MRGYIGAPILLVVADQGERATAVTPDDQLPQAVTAKDRRQLLMIQQGDHAQAWQKKTYHRVLQSKGFKAQTSKGCAFALSA
jgi:hypothetical protein